MRNKKILIFILCLLVLLFIISITIGTTHSDDQTFQEPDWLSSLGNLMAKPQPLQLADLKPSTASCLQQGKLVVPAGTTCIFAIQQSSFTQRVISLRLIQGTSARLILTNQEGIPPMQQTLPDTGAQTNTDLNIYPGKEYGQLSIQCLNPEGASACLLAPK
ncbi:hypothetical protein [Dictyobacter arantiisoli]|uniref:Uncharacterized protein n=1 Tax=Dictyobacter arantiisoli TaxID=2014874 RepID=A0A5A5TEW2_9CHLR|nr:hypothetical protein [Dictyobacter arantiisoli]GCF09778.1 hypothetical protein KDI_33420 [Dictyobacter arantiisoli]